MTDFQYIDHLKEYMTKLAQQYVKTTKPESLPVELRELSADKLVYLLTDHATPILRKIEDDAIEAAVERTARLIRYSQKEVTNEM